MKPKLFFISTFLLISFIASTQTINKNLNIISNCDTSRIDAYIGEIHYFGKNAKKAKYFPQLTCVLEDKRCNIIWVPSKSYNKRIKVTIEQLNDYVFKLEDNEFAKYPCYAFFINQNLQEFPDGTYISGFKFPSEVEV